MTSLGMVHGVGHDAPSLEALEFDVRRRMGRAGAQREAPPRIGAEIEFLVTDLATHGPVPIESSAGEPATLPVLRALAVQRGWRERRAACGAPAFEVPGGGELSFEPGGQIEYAAPPTSSVTDLVSDLRGMADLLRTTLGDHAMRVGDVGIDPVNALDDVPLQLPQVERYREMDAYFSRIGRAGARMMRQTASLQLNLDAGDVPDEVWRVLCGASPYALALFANSATYGGQHTDHQSYRAHTWRLLDGARTGVVAPMGAPDDYLQFALDAPAMLLGVVDGEYRSFREWRQRGVVTFDDWRTHLTTLFPEVRPRGHFEVRSCDAVPARWYAAPLAFFCGLAYDPTARRRALELIGDDAADSSVLATAGRCGIHDESLRQRARQLLDLAIVGCRSLGPRVISPALVEEVEDFRSIFPASRRSLADVRSSPG